MHKTIWFEVDTWPAIWCINLYEITWQQLYLWEILLEFTISYWEGQQHRRKSKHNTTTQEEDIVQEMQFFNGLALGSLSAFLSKVKKQSIIIFVGAQASKVRLASIPPFKDLVDGKLLWVPSKLH